MAQFKDDEFPIAGELFNEQADSADLDEYFKQSLLQCSFSSTADNQASVEIAKRGIVLTKENEGSADTAQEDYYENYVLHHDDAYLHEQVPSDDYYLDHAPQEVNFNLQEEDKNDKAYSELLAHFKAKLQDNSTYNQEPDLSAASQEQESNPKEGSNKRPQAKDKPALAYQVTDSMSVEHKEQVRLALACHCYSASEIYGEVSYFSPVPMQHVMPDNFGFTLGAKDVLGAAREVANISRMDVAFIEYLHRHYPMANYEDQQVFDLVLLALFSHMQEGDICINLNSLQDIYDTLEQWDVLRSEMFKRKQDCDAINNLLIVAQNYVPDSISSLEAILSRALCIGSPEEHNAPLVYSLKRLYLRRYFNYEIEVANYINQVVKIDFDEAKTELLRKLIGVLFPLDDGLSDVNWQKVAALMSSTSKFSVISGGPGTGKTTTVLRIILMLICLDCNNRNIKMCAPTGKAAARMGESIAKQLKDERTTKTIDQLAALTGLSSEEIRSYIPTDAVTVQKLIKTVPNHATPIFNKHRPLMCDVLVVDEVSMLDLALFAKLIAALPDNCQLILLGDKDQLASVEAGSVLADLCSCLNSTDKERVNPQTLNFIAKLSGYEAEHILQGKIADNVTLLQFSYRSKDVPQIGSLAALVNAPLHVNESDNVDVSLDKDIASYLSFKRSQRENENFDEQVVEDKAIVQRTEDVLAQFEQDAGQAININLYQSGTSSGSSEHFCLQFAKNCIARNSTTNYSAFLKYLEKRNFVISSDPNELNEIFKLMDRYRVLCSNHSGEFGDQNINKLIEQEVKSTYLKKVDSCLKGEFFPGKIVIITKNDSELQLVNGYVGFCALLKMPSSNNHELRVVIPNGIVDENGQSRMEFNIISPMLLTNYDSGFAMSIHKSQGSEYDHVSIMLSKEPNRVLNKELVYTGITRAKKSLTLLGTKASLAFALGNSVQRRSGLALRISAQS